MLWCCYAFGLLLHVLKNPKPSPSAANCSSKTKFVPLFSPEGHDRTAAVIPGIHSNYKWS